MSKNKMNLDELISRTKVYLIIIAIILIVLSIIEPKAIIPSIVFYALVLLYSVWSSKKRKAEITKHIDELTLNVDKAAQSTIINSPFPLVVVETSGNIIWKSSNFIKTFANIDIGTYLSDIIKELKQKIDKDNNEVKLEGVEFEVLDENNNVKNVENIEFADLEFDDFNI